jgi:hypothetical protein
MLIRKLIFLFIIFCIVYSCKKDNPPRLYNGIVLYTPGNIPVPDATVNLTVMKRGTGSFGTQGGYSTVTNTKGGFVFPINVKSDSFYILQVTKNGLIQASPYLIYTTTGNDTVYLQDPAYARLIVKIKTTPPTDSHYFLKSVFGESNVYLENSYSRIYSSVGTDTILCRYAPGITHEGVVTLSRSWKAPSYPDDSILVIHKFKPDPTKTTDVLIEY